MKKSTVYFIVPILALVAFAGYYMKFIGDYDRVLAAKAAAVKSAKEDKLRLEQATREKAINDAIAAQEERKKERAAKEAKDKARRDDREAANLALSKARIEADKVQRQSERMTKEVQATKDEIAKLEQEKAHFQSEAAFLAQYVAATRGNTKSLTAVLDKINEADEAIARAAALAAAAAAKKSS